MTVKELRKILQNYTADAHVVIAMLPPIPIHQPGKYEIYDTWVDDAGVLNLISGRSACQIDPNLKEENNL